MLRENGSAPRLVTGEPESVSVAAHYVAGLGWHLTILVRRQFQEWSEASKGVYEQLTTPEMVCVIDAALSAELRV